MKMQNPTIQILADWGDCLAVQKPASWLTIPGRGQKEGVPVLSHLLGEQLRGSSVRTKNDLFVVHRLDSGTSGVILFARTPEAHRELSRLFEGREVKKVYWCLVKGRPQSQTVDAPLFKLPSKKNKSVVDEKGKPSRTEIVNLMSREEYSLVEARPLTGRSHQIRVHLSFLGAPLVGDVLYGGPRDALGMEFEHPLLHSRRIEFEWRGSRRVATATIEAEFLLAAEGLGFSSACSVAGHGGLEGPE